MDEFLDDTFKTGGHSFRTPGEPQLIAALGRALWNFLNLEEIVVAIAYEAHEDFQLVREMKAGGKIKKLESIKERFEKMQAGNNVAEVIQKAIDTFKVASTSYRNAISHAKPYTYRYDEKGRYLPGLTLYFENSVTNIESADDLLEIASKIEDAINPLNNARLAVMSYMESFGKGKPTFENH